MTADVAAPAKPNRLARLLARAPWRLIGVALLVVVLLRVDLRQVAAQFERIGPVSIAEAALAFLVLLVCRCWRWRVLTRSIGDMSPLWANVASCNRSIWLGMATPGRLGELSRAADLAATRGWTLTAAGALVLFDLSLDLSAYVALALGGMLYFSLPASWTPLALGALVLAIVLAVLLAARLIGLAVRFAPFLARLPGLAEVLPSLARGFRDGAAIGALLGTLGAATSYVLMLMCLTRMMQPSIDWTLVAPSIGMAGLAGAVPVTIFGLGTREAVLIWFLGPHGIDAAHAVAFSFTIILAQLIGIAVSVLAGLPLGMVRKLENPAS